MRTIIPCAGFNSRLGIQGPKGLLDIGSITILGRLLEIVPSPITLIVNDLYVSEFKRFLGRLQIYNNGLRESNNKIGCLTNIRNFLNDKGIYDDILIVVADIIFDFSLFGLIKFFKSKKEICIPIKKLGDDETMKAGAVLIDNENRITNFLEHGLIVGTDYSELGIYLVPKDRLYLIGECVEKYHNDSPGYLIEYIYKKVPVYGIEVKGNWFHVTTEEDYLEISNHVNSKDMDIDPDLQVSRGVGKTIEFAQ